MNGKKAKKLRREAKVRKGIPTRYNCKLEETASKVIDEFSYRGKQLLCTDARVTYQYLKSKSK